MNSVLQSVFTAVSTMLGLRCIFITVKVCHVHGQAKIPKIYLQRAYKSFKKVIFLISTLSIPVDSWLSRGESLPSNQFLRENPSKLLLVPFFRFLSPSRHCLTCTVKCLFLNLTMPTNSRRARFFPSQGWPAGVGHIRFSPRTVKHGPPVDWHRHE